MKVSVWDSRQMGKSGPRHPDKSNVVLDLEFESEFGLLLDMTGETQRISRN